MISFRKTASSAATLFILLTSLLSISNSLWAQAVGQISGMATDPSGAPLPGLTVTAIQTDTSLTRTATTDNSGAYLLPNLPLGPYRLEATKAGFRGFVQTGIVLQVDSSPVIPIGMQLGEVSSTIEVQANATQVETTNMGVGSVIENQRILDLPLNGRNPTDLIILAGSAVQTAASPAWTMSTGVNISVAGGLAFGVQYLMDGAQHINPFDGTGMPLPFPDALQEFKLETSALPAQYGTHSGGTVNAVTKSGSNAFHGDAFEFLRNNAVNARNFFSATPDTLKRNQFGGTVGGPILKDKLFFFAAVQGTTIRALSNNTTTFVPTAQEAAGNFTTFASAQCQGTQKTLGGPFVNNQLPVSLISPQALAIASHFPQSSDPCGKILYGDVLHENTWQGVGRIDYSLGSKQTIFGRYIVTKDNVGIPLSFNPNNILTTVSASISPTLSVAANGRDDMATSVAVGDTYLISGTTINSFRIALNRVSAPHPGPSFFGPQDVGINAYAALPHFMPITISGGPSLGTSTSASGYLFETTGTLNDDFSIIRGAHQLSFGGNLGLTKVYSLYHVFSEGTWGFTGQVTGLGMGDFFAGDLTNFRQQTPNPLVVAQYFFGLYAQDSWKVTPRLTVNYGLRWDPFLPEKMGGNSNFKESFVYNFSQANFNQGIVSKTYPNAPPGLVYPGDPGFIGQSGQAKEWGNLSPRLGLAWDPWGDGRTSIRAGAGIAYDFVNTETNLNSVAGSPFGGQIIIPSANLANPYAGISPAPFPYSFSSSATARFQPYGSYLPIPPNLQTPKVYSWNLAIQRQINHALFASASYVGNEAIHTLFVTELNPPVLIPGAPIVSSCASTSLAVNCVGNENVRRQLNLQNPAAQLGALTSYSSGGTQSYNGLLLNSTYKPTGNLNIIANYTWSHCIGDAVNSTTPNPQANLNHIYDRALDRGNCAYDHRQIFNLTAVLQSPKFSRTLLRAVGTGWTLSPIYRFQTGDYLTIASGNDSSLTGFSAQRANLVNTDTAATNQGSACAGVAPCVSWLNPASFAIPALGTFGNLGTLNVLGPHFFQFDIALSRDFNIREGERLNFRFEAFNLTNSVRYSDPAVSLASSTTFGRILSSYDPRILEFALKYFF